MGKETADKEKKSAKNSRLRQTKGLNELSTENEEDAANSRNIFKINLVAHLVID